MLLCKEFQGEILCEILVYAST